MATQVYEGLFIFDTTKYARDAAAVSGALSTVVQNFGGEILASRLWEERRLAYPIAGQRKGTYWLTYFKIDSRKITELERQYKLDDNILRSMILKVEPRIVETLVQHALTGEKPVLEHPLPVEEPEIEALNV